MAITGMGETIDDVKLALARRIYTAVVLNASVLKIKDLLKYHEIEHFVNVLKKRSQWNGVKPFLQHYPCFFLITEEANTSVVKPIVTVEFCRDFDGKKGCDRPYCSKLHVCRHFVKGKCTFGPRCKKPHHFDNQETREVLKKHFLDGLSNEQAREFLCRNVQHLLEPDTLSTELPKSLEICKYYNVATGCTRDFCPYIHVCRFYAEEGNCKFGSQCIRKHDINNVHSRILLHRYHMDHLSDAQVITYLKIKGESRDQQLLQSNVNTQNMKNEKLQQQQTSPSMKLPTYFPNHFSLPTTSSNGFLSDVQNFMNNENSRKLSQPNPPMQVLPIIDHSVHTRKLSLPNPTGNKSGIRNVSTAPDSSKLINMKPSSMPHDVFINHLEDNLSLKEQSNGVSSFSRQISSALSFPNHYSTSSLQHSLNSDLLDAFTKTSCNMISTPSLSYSSEHVSHSLKDHLLPYIQENGRHSGTHAHRENNNNDSEFGLGLNNLSSPPTNTSLLYNNQSKNDERKLNDLLGHNFLKSRSFENFQKGHFHENTPTLNGTVISKSHSIYSDTFSSSLQTKMHYKSTSPRSNFLRASSSDIISPTGSSSSINGVNGFTNGLPDHSLFFGSSDWTDHQKNLDDELNFICYRTRSLPNFNSHNNSEKIMDKTNRLNLKNTLAVECECRKSEVCVYYLLGECQVTHCERLHIEETFQWQISSVPAESTSKSSFAPNSYVSYNNTKNENDPDTTITREWVNLEKNENIKLEIAFSSCEIEQTDIDFFGDTLTIYFEDMIGVGTAKTDISSTNQIISSRSCDLSSWLLQPNDDSISLSGSQENVVYNIRRVSTKSTVLEHIDPRLATQWMWYWQDSFGMWREYPRSKNDVIELNVCLNEDIERRFVEGCNQCVFDEFQMLFDFKNMLQTNTLSRKQKKIRRRTVFTSIEQRRTSDNTHVDKRYEPDLIYPYYWPSNRSENSSAFEFVALDSSSDIFQFVANQFKESMVGQNDCHEIVGLKSIQNIELWRQFSRLKNQLLDAKVQIVEKFVFKMVSESQLSEICQHGFHICTCDATSEERVFHRNAHSALKQCDERVATQPSYMFCLRMSVSEESEKKNSDVDFNDTIECKHGNQVYPEFLIVFNRY